MNEKKRIWRPICDLGQAAYVKLHGFSCVGRRSKNYYFEIDEDRSNEFDQLCIEYANSPMQDFDSALMSLKKLPDYLPDTK